MITRPRAESSAQKVLIAGAFATGKTTLAWRLIEKFREGMTSVSLITGTPRRIPFALNKEQTPLATAWLIGEQIKTEVEVMAREPNLVICDRGLPDFISHTIILGLDDKEKAFVDDLVTIARRWSRTYRVVLWAKSDPVMPIDPAGGIRLADKAYQKELETSIEQSFRLLELEPIILPSSTQERVRFVLELLGRSP